MNPIVSEGRTARIDIYWTNWDGDATCARGAAIPTGSGGFDDELVVTLARTEGELPEVGQPVMVEASVEEGIYAVHARVRALDPAARVMKIELDGRVQRVQRRQYYRQRMDLTETAIRRVTDDGEEQPAERARLWDLSGGGFSFLTDITYEAGQRLDVTLRVDARGPITVRAEVLACEALGAWRADGLRWKVRAHFPRLMERHRTRIIRAIYRREIQRRAEPRLSVELPVAMGRAVDVLGNPTDLLPLRIADLSNGGMAADTVMRLNPGDTVTVPLRVDLRGDLVVHATVVASRAVDASPEGFAWRLHARFLPLPDKDRARLAAYLFRREMLRNAPIAA